VAVKQDSGALAYIQVALQDSGALAYIQVALQAEIAAKDQTTGVDTSLSELPRPLGRGFRFHQRQTIVQLIFGFELLCLFHRRGFGPSQP
jgi:hypothetical protein